MATDVRMQDKAPAPTGEAGASRALDGYRVDLQVGFLLRRAMQRHLGIFSAGLPDLTPTQFAALAKAAELGPVSQNELGRATAMDAATIKGVIDRLVARGLMATGESPTDRRRVMVSLTPEGEAILAAVIPAARAITAETLAPLEPSERVRVLGLLERLGGEGEDKAS